MNNKAILVTGATSGMGESIARLFHKKGATVILVARNAEKLKMMMDELQERVLVYPLDMSQLENIKDLFEFCKKKQIKLDGIVHCAGITLSYPVRANTVTETDNLIKVNFESFVQLCRFAASKRYTNDGASIIAMSSTASIAGGKCLSVYAASKAALNVFVKSAATEFSSRKIRINAIAPAMVRTQMYYETLQQAPYMKEDVESMQPFGVIEPENIAEFAAYLMSDSAKYITGSVSIIGAGHVF